MAADERARAGIFLAFQYPVEIPGVTTSAFLKTALNAKRRAEGKPEIDAMEFLKLVKTKTAALGMPYDMIKRALNVGFSGGEKKRAEVLQMTMLEPLVRSSMKPIPVSTSTPCVLSPTASIVCARRTVPSW